MSILAAVLAAGSVNITPNASGLPGVSALEHIVGALLTFGTIAAVAGLVLAAATWAVGNHKSNPQVVSRGRSGVLASLVAAVLIGGALVLVNFFLGVGAAL